MSSSQPRLELRLNNNPLTRPLSLELGPEAFSGTVMHTVQNTMSAERMEALGVKNRSVGYVESEYYNVAARKSRNVSILW